MASSQTWVGRGGNRHRGDRMGQCQCQACQNEEGERDELGHYQQTAQPGALAYSAVVNGGERCDEPGQHQP